MNERAEDGPVKRGARQGDRIPWTGYYINAGGAQARGTIEAELSKAGLAALYTPVEAIGDAPPHGGQAGLTSTGRGTLWSHRKVVEADNPGDRFVHVLEDNVVLARSFRAVIEQFIRGSLFAAFDLIFTSLRITTPPDDLIHILKNAYAKATAPAPDVNFGLMNIRGLNFSSAEFVFHQSGQPRQVARHSAAGMRAR